MGIAMTGVEYVCRYCERATYLYVEAEPNIMEGGFEADPNRIEAFRCDDCETDRVHVLALTLPEEYEPRRPEE